jgi:hypothetical protein
MVPAFSRGVGGNNDGNNTVVEEAPVGRMVLPQFVSRHGTTGDYRYYRRPPKGIQAPAFVRHFGTRDIREVQQQYAQIHAEAQAYFRRLTSGQTLDDETVRTMGAMLAWYGRGDHQSPLRFREDFRALLDRHELGQTDLIAADRDAIAAKAHDIYLTLQTRNIVKQRESMARLVKRESELRKVTEVPASKSGLRLMAAYEQAWSIAEERPESSKAEYRRFVEGFIALNGDLDLRELTREHWSSWRSDCLQKYGPGWTSFKRFNGVKTVVNEAIRAGLLERRFHTGQDVTLKKPKNGKLRNEGWSDAEIKTLFTSEAFTLQDDAAAYWIPTIIALTGARLSEVADMQVRDVSKRHGMWTFYLACEGGKTEESRRIIPVPETVIDLGFLEYLRSRSKSARLFDATELLDDANRLMADREAFAHRIFTAKDMNVGAADRGCRHTNQCVERPNIRDRL